jgi:hypothetical protein
MIDYYYNNPNKPFKNIRYVYYGGNTFAPFFEDIQINGLVGLNDIFSKTIDVSTLSKDNVYYKNMYKNVVDNFFNYFNSYRVKINEKQYYNFFNNFNKKTNFNGRTNNNIKQDLNYISKNKLNADEFTKKNSDLVYRDDTITVHAPYNMDCMRILMSKTYSCYLTDIDKIYSGYINENTIFYVIQKKGIKNININHVFKNELEVFVNRNGIVMLEDNYFKPNSDGYPSEESIDELKLYNVKNIISKVKPTINNHYKNNKDIFFKEKINKELFFYM